MSGDRRPAASGSPEASPVDRPPRVSHAGSAGSRHLVRLAAALWIAWAIVMWNVVFDHTVEVAARGYVRAAAEAAQAGSPSPRADQWMRPAAMRGALTASAAAAGVLAAGFGSHRLSRAVRLGKA